MRAFEVFLNGKRLCLAGIGNHGVLSTTITYVSGRGEPETRLDIGGLVMPEKEHMRWRRPSLRVGDEVRVKIVDRKSVDKPRKRSRTDPASEIAAQKRYVRMMAGKFGWKIQERRKSN